MIKIFKDEENSLKSILGGNLPIYVFKRADVDNMSLKRHIKNMLKRVKELEKLYEAFKGLGCAGTPDMPENIDEFNPFYRCKHGPEVTLEEIMLEYKIRNDWVYQMLKNEGFIE